MGKETEAQETTLDLDQVMADGMEVFQGEPDEGAAQEDTPITPKPGAGDSPPQTGHPAEDAGREPEKSPPEAKPTDTPTGEGAETQTPDVKEAGEPGKTPDETDQKFRFKSHEEAEKGYRHLQAEKTRIEQAKKDLEAKLTAQKDAEARKAKEQEAENKIFDYSTARYQEALKAINDLDPDEEGYQDQVSKIWAAKDRDVWRFERQLLEKPDANGANQPQANEKADESQGEPANTQDQVLAYVDEQAQEAGIDPEDEHFKLVCQQTPSRDESGRDMTLGEQVKWAIDKTLAYHRTLAGQLQERQRKAAAEKTASAQDRNLPLGRSGAVPKSTEGRDAKPVTLDDALSEAMEGRRL